MVITTMLAMDVVIYSPLGECIRLAVISYVAERGKAALEELEAVAREAGEYISHLGFALSNEEELFRGLAESGIDAVLVIDAWSETHMPLARRYMELAERYILKYVLSEHKLAEIYAVELCESECGAPLLPGITTRC